MGRSRILLAEHDRGNRILTCGIVEKAGSAADIADGGWQSVDIAIAVPCDLLLMYIGLPEMDGLAAAIQIRHSLRRRDIPITELSALAGEALARQCLSAGMNEVLPVPSHEQAPATCIDRW